MKTIILDIVKVVAYIEDYCAVLAFASDTSAEPQNYLILTRETEYLSALPVAGDYEWDLQIDCTEEINHLTGYELCSANQLKFYFDHRNLCLQMNLTNEYDIQLEQWLEFIFKT